MCVHDAPVLEVHELMLAATLDTLDRRAAQRSGSGGRETPAQRRMENTDLGDSASDERATKPANGGFNLG
jgi:uncharacterized protein YceH (UPF0502 family)